MGATELIWKGNPKDRRFELNLPITGGNAGEEPATHLKLFLQYHENSRRYMLSIHPVTVAADGGESFVLSKMKFVRLTEPVARYNGRQLEAWRTFVGDAVLGRKLFVWDAVAEALTAGGFTLLD